MAKRSIHGCRVLITGASSGIGQALALELASEGADLVAVARRKDRLERVAEIVRRRGRKIECVVGDITDAGIRQAALDRAREALGGLDLLINNAGVSAHGRFADADPDRLARIMDVNFFSAVELIRSAIPLLQEGSTPMIVNIGSILGHRGIPHQAEYCASKFALRGFSESIRPEMAKLGIDVLMVSPGSTDTDMFDHLIEKKGEIPWKPNKGVSPKYVAHQTVRAIRRGAHEIIPSGKGKLLVIGSKVAPRLIDRVLGRFG